MSDDGEAKPASAARIYDYFLGGTHNFPADREAAQTMLQVLPLGPQMARTNRAFLRRAVRYLAESGIRQFLDVGSGIPTEGNVHEIVQQVEPEACVVYVDIDPVAVAESLELLDGNPFATVVNADLRDPSSILTHPQVTALLDFDRPIGLVLGAVLHFVPDDETAHAAVGRLLAAMAPGSHLLISHATADEAPHEQDEIDMVHDIYRHRTATPLGLRTRAQIERFFDGLDLVDPGVVWLPLWRPAPDDPQYFADDPTRSAGIGGVGRIPPHQDR
ncbi:SAM-dependent methyltransferase [Micromonospora sp. NPDC047134]|uniref:SAM-dependent methyltransferase n=1 Tax=Micromonospora sp. NPDC047134 TaxID=3154340 RepID=UPI0033E68002